MKIVNGATGSVVVLKTGANVKDLTIDPRNGRVYAMNRGPGTISVIDPDTDAIVDTLKADRGSLTALNPATNRLYVSASTGTDPSVIDLATKTSTVIHAGTEGNALSVNVKANKIYFVGYEDNFLTVVDGVTNQPTRIDCLASISGIPPSTRRTACSTCRHRTTMRLPSSIRRPMSCPPSGPATCHGRGRERRHQPHLRRELR